MSEINCEKPIKIRQDYIDAAERCAILAEKLLQGQKINKQQLNHAITRWRKLRKEIVING